MLSRQGRVGQLKALGYGYGKTGLIDAS